MADISDAELDGLLQNTASTVSDDELDRLIQGGPQHGSMLEGMAHKALEAGTLHASKYAMSPETLAKTKRFEKEHPILSGVGEAGGIVGGAIASAYIPGMQGTLPARAGVAATRLAKLADYILPWGSFSRAAAPTAGWKTAANQSGMGMLKYGAATRAIDPLTERSQTGDSATDILRDVAQRGQKAGDLYGLGADYLGGGAGGVAGKAIGNLIGGRIAETGQKALLGGMPNRNAVVGIAHELERDAPAGTDAAIKGVRDLVYGEDQTLGRHGGGSVDQEGERMLARNFTRLTNQGLNDSQAADRMGPALARLTGRLDRRAAQGIAPSENTQFLLQALNKQGGAGFTPATMGGWGRAVGTAYRDRNAVPSNLTELVALATGGEAPALQSTQRKLLNLSSEGQNRSNMLRTLRERQKGIGLQMQSTMKRLSGSRDISEVIASHAANAKNANALYGPIFADLKAMGPEAEQKIAQGLWPTIETALKRGDMTDDISKAVAKEAQKFMQPRELPMTDPSMQPLSSMITENVKDPATGQIIKKIQRQVPLEKELADGTRQTQQFSLGSVAESNFPTGNLESILAHRRTLQDAIDTAYRGGQKNLGYDLKQLKDGIDEALRGMGTGKDAFAQTMKQWGAANDSRAYAGSLERAHNEALGLNLSAKRGGGLVELERFYSKFRNMDDAHKDVARQGVFDQFKAILDTGGDLHDVAKVFTNKRARTILTEVMGPEAAAELGDNVARAGLATNSFNMNKGSQTASIIDKDKESGWLESLWGIIYKGNPVHAVGKLGEMAGDAMKRKKYDAMTKLLSADTNNPTELEAVLKNLQRAVAPVSQRLRAVQDHGRMVGTVGGAAATKRRDE